MGQDGCVTTEEHPRNRRLATVVPVWALSLLGAVLVGVLSPRSEYLIWLPIVLAASTFATFCIQLATREKNGFVNRAMASVGGALVILMAATAVLGAVAAASG